MVEEVFSEAGELRMIKRRDRGAPQDAIIRRVIFSGEFGRGEIFENIKSGVKMLAEVFFGGFAFFTVA